MWKLYFALACASIHADCLASPYARTRLMAMASTEIPDSTPGVLQNRYFTKQWRAEVGLSAGSILNESYSKTVAVGARAGLFVSEKVGLEYNFSKLSSKDSADLVSLKSQEVCIELECRSIEPSFIRLHRMHQLQVVTAPVYGKINLFDWAILYSDLTFSAGAAQVDTSQGRKWAFTPAIGQRFYFSKSLSLRVDATDIYLKETIQNGSAGENHWRHNWIAQVGLSAFLNSGE